MIHCQLESWVGYITALKGRCDQYQQLNFSIDIHLSPLSFIHVPLCTHLPIILDVHSLYTFNIQVRQRPALSHNYKSLSLNSLSFLAMSMDGPSGPLPPESHQLGTVETTVSVAELPTDPAKPITFDQYGDLSLLVGKNPHSRVILVDSRALCRASPVFRKMLRGSFAEQQPTNGEDWVVKLPEDKPTVIATLCDLCHGQATQTLRSPSFRSLYDIVVAADKYDMIRCLRLVTRRWLTRYFQTFPGKPLDIPETFNLLLVAGHLGDVALTKKVIGKIANNVHLDTSGNLTHGESSMPVEEYAEPNLFDVIGKICLLNQ